MHPLTRSTIALSRYISFYCALVYRRSAPSTFTDVETYIYTGCWTQGCSGANGSKTPHAETCMRAGKMSEEFLCAYIVSLTMCIGIVFRDYFLCCCFQSVRTLIFTLVFMKIDIIESYKIYFFYFVSKTSIF